nr:hypothetical protein Iba_chr09dCG1600 [Ipomoea batatas]
MLFNESSRHGMGTATNGIPFVAGTLSLAAALEAQRPDRTGFLILEPLVTKGCSFRALLLPETFGLQTSLVTRFSMLESSRHGMGTAINGIPFVAGTLFETFASLADALEAQRPDRTGFPILPETFGLQTSLLTLFSMLESSRHEMGTATNGIPFVAGTLSLAACTGSTTTRSNWFPDVRLRKPRFPRKRIFQTGTIASHALLLPETFPANIIAHIIFNA